MLGFRTDTLPLFYSADGGPARAAACRGRGDGRSHRRGALGARRLRLLSRTRPTQSLDVDELVEDAVAEAVRAGHDG